MSGTLVGRFRNLMQPPNTALSGDASARFAFVRRRVVVLGALVIIGLIVGSLHALWLSYRQSLEATDRELANLSRALSEQTAWTWEAIDLLLRDTEQWYLTDGRGQSKELIDRVLADRAAGMRQVRTLIIADADGIPRYRSDRKALPGFDVSKRPYFVALRDGPSTGLFITEPLVTRDGRTNIVVLGRRLEDDNANFLGVVTATIDLQNLQDLYGAVKLGSGDAVDLLRKGGTLLVRNPPAPDLAGRKFPALVNSADSSPVRITSPVDGTRNFVSIAPVRGAPLVLTVTRREAVALSTWRDGAVSAAVRTLGLSLLGVLTVVAIVRQLNRLEAAERALLESKERQAQSQKLEALGSLAGGIAHDFNNILGAILGYGELAQQNTSEGSALRRYVDNVMHAGARAKVLVERILGFSRSGMSDRVPVNIQAVVEETLELLEPSLPAEIRLARTLAAGNAAVIGDATRLLQVAMNLCTNAVKAMPSGGTLRVALRRVLITEARPVIRGSVAAGPYVLLAVSDTGIGIPPAVLGRIFEPFFTTKAVGEGTGLGLSLVDGIVHDLGGAIAHHTQQGRGTTFNIWLPLAGETAVPSAQPSTGLSNGNGAAVMVVDDEQALVALCEEMLAGLGYEPGGFESSAAALAAFRRTPERFDLVLTDENMPGFTGTELTRALRQVRPDIPVVLMSGYAGAQLAERAAAVGINEVLRKPLQRRDLSEALARTRRGPIRIPM
jgi:signal transduction histidine kinase/ActR/RegA family two-component response regulator